MLSDHFSYALKETAPAKVNLSLRIRGRRAGDGYHELSSLVGFASAADQLFLNPGPGFNIKVVGPFWQSIVGDNLVYNVGRALMQEYQMQDFGDLVLQKNLPVAAGLGGGSADAGAFIRLFARVAGVSFSQEDIKSFGARFGADVPVCVLSKPAMMYGIGDVLEPVERFPSLGILLVNPGVSVSTGVVFESLAAPEITRGFAHQEGALAFASGDELVAYMQKEPNDLTLPAQKLAPEIETVLHTLKALQGCSIARLSGSGATCFGLFEDENSAQQAAQFLQAKHRGWWVSAGKLSGLD